MSRANAPPASQNAYTAHVDTFCRDKQPPPELWPEMDWSAFPELANRERLNCAAELLDLQVAAGLGSRTVFYSNSGDWTYGRLLEQSNRIARILVNDLAVVPGNRVLLHGPNSPLLAACWFAVLKAGGVVVCTMPMLRSRELVPILRKANIDLCLADASVADECEQAVKIAGRDRCEVVRLNSGDSAALEMRPAAVTDEFKNCETAATDVAIIAFTSGTTGEGKGTMHCHRDVMVVTECFPRFALRPCPDDIFCGTPSIAFTYGLGGLLLFPMRTGASAVLLERGSPPALLEAIQKFRASICFTSPTAYRAMLPELEKYAISSLQKCVSAGETLPLSTFETWRKATGVKIIDGIGATELLHIFMSAPEDEIRPGATGKPLRGYQAMVLDDNGEEMSPGQIGRLAVRGPTGCRYLDDISQQKQYVQNGWNVTGDAFRKDEDGYFWYHARLDDMIISGGYNISGPEVENVLLEHSKVSDCAVIGVCDDRRGMVGKAFVVLRAGVVEGPHVARELQEFVKAQIAPYKYPRAVEFVDSLPRTATGKLQRHLLREGSR